mmetsp:Transcript_23256/g.71273  ORF Transcript_23256/g.71273 Transcript_23256/m.71273 type:complete len:101 (-) Transcript_23256:311-613(-)
MECSRKRLSPTNMSSHELHHRSGGRTKSAFLIFVRGSSSSILIQILDLPWLALSSFSHLSMCSSTKKATRVTLETLDQLLYFKADYKILANIQTNRRSKK